MPRATTSREAGIINYFKTTDLAIAVIVLGLCKEALGERQARSAEAKARAVKPAPPAPKATPAAAAPKPKAKAKAKKKSHKKAKAAPTAQIEGSVYDEADLNG